MGRIVQVICGCVLAVALGAAQSADPVGKQGGWQGRAPESQDRTQGQPESAAPASVEDSLQRIARNVEASQTGPEAEQGEKRATRDLRAQESMALWAKWMFFAAALTTVISGVGVFLIWRTLLHTRSAAEAGAEIVTVTRESAEKQLRAYITVEPVAGSVLMAGKPISINLRLKNVGLTPARNVRFCSACAIRSPGQFVAGPLEDESPMPRQLMMPNGERFMTGATDPPDPIEQRHVDALRAGTAVLYATGFVEYTDAFGHERRTEYSFELAGRECFDRMTMRSSNTGNDFT